MAKIKVTGQRKLRVTGQGAPRYQSQPGTILGSIGQPNNFAAPSFPAFNQSINSVNYPSTQCPNGQQKNPITGVCEPIMDMNGQAQPNYTGGTPSISIDPGGPNTVRNPTTGKYETVDTFQKQPDIYKGQKTPRDLFNYNTMLPSAIIAGMSGIRGMAEGLQGNNLDIEYAKRLGQTDAFVGSTPNKMARGNLEINTGAQGLYTTPVNFAGRPTSEFVGYPAYQPQSFFKKEGGELEQYQTKGQVTRPIMYTDDLNKVKLSKDSFDLFNQGELYKNKFQTYVNEHNTFANQLITPGGENVLPKLNFLDLRQPLNNPKIKPIKTQYILGEGALGNSKGDPNYQLTENINQKNHVYNNPSMKLGYIGDDGFNVMIGVNQNTPSLRTYKNPVYNYQYRKTEPKPEPTLHPRVMSMQPIPFTSQSSTPQLRTMEQPNIEMPAVQRGQYRTSYYDPQMKDWNEKAFMSQKESDQFADEMSKRGYPGSYGNVTQRTQFQKGGTLSNIFTNNPNDPRLKSYSDSSIIHNYLQKWSDLVNTPSTTEEDTRKFTNEPDSIAAIKSMRNTNIRGKFIKEVPLTTKDSTYKVSANIEYLPKPQPVLYRPNPELIPFNVQDSTANPQLRTIENPNIQMSGAVPQGNWNVEYLDPNSKKTQTKHFISNEDAEQFYNDPANAASRKYSNASSVGRMQNGGWLSKYDEGGVGPCPTNMYWDTVSKKCVLRPAPFITSDFDEYNKRLQLASDSTNAAVASRASIEENNINSATGNTVTQSNALPPLTTTDKSYKEKPKVAKRVTKYKNEPSKRYTTNEYKEKLVKEGNTPQASNEFVDISASVISGDQTINPVAITDYSIDAKHYDEKGNLIDVSGTQYVPEFQEAKQEVKYKESPPKYSVTYSTPDGKQHTFPYIYDYDTWKLINDRYAGSRAYVSSQEKGDKSEASLLLKGLTEEDFNNILNEEYVEGNTKPVDNLFDSKPTSSIASVEYVQANNKKYGGLAQYQMAGSVCPQGFTKNAFGQCVNASGQSPNQANTSRNIISQVAKPPVVTAPPAKTSVAATKTPYVYPSMTMPINRTDVIGRTPIQEIKDNQQGEQIHAQNVAESKKQFISQGHASTPDEEKERLRKNNLYASQNSNASVDAQGNLSTVNPDRTMEGAALPYTTAAGIDKGMTHMQGAMDAAAMAIGVGELASLGLNGLKSMRTPIMSNATAEALPAIQQSGVGNLKEMFTNPKQYFTKPSGGPTYTPNYENISKANSQVRDPFAETLSFGTYTPAPRVLDWNKVGTTAAGIGVGSGLLSAAGKNWLKEPKKKDGGLTQYQEGNLVLPGAMTPDRPMSYSDMPVVADYFPRVGNPEIAPVSASADNMPAPYQASGPVDIDAALKAVAGAESGSRPGQTKLGKRTDLVGEDGKRATASGTYQITQDTLKQIYSRYFKDDYPSFTNFNNSVKSDADVEYAAARALMTENVNKYGIYGIGAWYYPQYAARAAAGDMSVWNKIPRQDYGNKLTWGQDFTKKYNLYKQYAKFKEGGEYELDDNEIQDILANGGQIEYL